MQNHEGCRVSFLSGDDAQENENMMGDLYKNDMVQGYGYIDDRRVKRDKWKVSDWICVFILIFYLKYACWRERHATGCG